jgi:hypothetical protein
MSKSENKEKELPGLSKIPDIETLKARFSGDSIDPNCKQFRAYEKAWDARKHEIDNYWKRATYFWAFQVASLTAYSLMINSTSYNSTPRNHPFTLFFSIAIGFVTALAWLLTNKGSKFWQRHWEKQIDILEDEITGPLYKTVYAYKSPKTFSVSKINEIVSVFFVAIWLCFGVNYFLENLAFARPWSRIAYEEIIISIATVCSTCSMLFGYGRGRFGPADFNYYHRNAFTDSQSDSKT